MAIDIGERLASDLNYLTGERLRTVTAALVLVHPDDRPRVEASWQRAQHSGRLMEECRLRDYAGRYRRVRLLAERRERICRDEWTGYVREIDGDHGHRCMGSLCYCVNTLPT